MAEVDVINDKVYNFSKLLPKIELHAHLNGCIRESTLLELMHQQQISLTHELRNLLSNHSNPQQHDDIINDLNPITKYTTNHRRRSLSECFQIFPLIHKCVCNLSNLERITREALKDFWDENVCYLELRTTPRCLFKTDLRNEQGEHPIEVNNTFRITKEEYVARILSVFQEHERKEWRRYNDELLRFQEQHQQQRHENLEQIRSKPRLPLIPRLLISIDRSASVQEALENVHLAIKLYQSGNRFVVGVDLGGNPTKNEFCDFEPVLTLARNSGLKISIHCGEVKAFTSGEDNRYAKEANDILQFRPDRLGHAMFLPESVYSKLYQNTIPIECCPTSNTMTLELNLIPTSTRNDEPPKLEALQNNHDKINKIKKVNNMTEIGGDLIYGLRQHPKLSEWIKLNYPISISTDDSGVFHTNSSLEHYRIMKAFIEDANDMGKIVIQSIDHIFAQGSCSGEDVQSDERDATNCDIKAFLKANLTERSTKLVHWVKSPIDASNVFLTENDK